MNATTSLIDRIAGVLLVLAVIGIALTASIRAEAAEFAISPMLIETEAEAGSSVPFRFNIYGKTAGSVRISLAGMQQQPTGHMKFLPSSPDTGGLAAWIRLERTGLSVRREETQSVSGMINVPRRTPAGTYVAAVLVEEADDGRKKGIVVNVRYAIIISLYVGGAQGRVVTEFRDIRLEQQSDRVFVAASFRNAGNRDNVLESELQLRDAGNRVVHRTPLKSQSAWQRADDGSRVFPGADVVVFGEIPRSLTAGEYQVTVRNRFGGRSQPVQRATLHLPATLFGPAVAHAAPPADARPPQLAASAAAR